MRVNISDGLHSAARLLEGLASAGVPREALLVGLDLVVATLALLREGLAEGYLGRDGA